MSELRQRGGKQERQSADTPGGSTRKGKPSASGGGCLMQFLWCSVALGAMSCVLLALYAVTLRTPAAPVQEADIEAAGNRWVRLKDGRLLEYATCGDPKGLPVYAATGYSSTANLLATPWMCKISAQHGLRIISVTMPGFGLSDSLPLGYKRSIVDWPADIFTILDKEGIDKFAVLGTSTGCVHAMSVAWAAPERIMGVMLNTPTAPLSIEGTCKGIATETKYVKLILGTPYAGDLLGRLLSAVDARSRMQAAPDIALALTKLESLGGEYLQIVNAYASDFERATVHTYRGWADNMHTISADVPFSLTEVAEKLSARGVKMGISTAPDDTTNPPPMQEWFHGQLPGSEMLHVEPGLGHAHLLEPKNFERFVKYIVDSWAAVKKHQS